MSVQRGTETVKIDKTSDLVNGDALRSFIDFLVFEFGEWAMDIEGNLKE